MLRPLRVLIVEDVATDAELVVLELGRAGFAPDWQRVDTEAAFVASLGEEWDIILSDFKMPGFSGLRALEIAQELDPQIPFILVSGTIGEDVAVEAMKKGAADYLLKDRLTRLGPAVIHALDQARLRKESKHAEEAMRQSEHKYRHLFESLGEAALLIDRDTRRILDANHCAQQLLGRGRTEILGTDARNLFPASETGCDGQPFTSFIAPTVADHLEETEVATKDGRRIPVQFSFTPVELHGRNLVLALMTDITSRKRAEDVLREQAAMLDQAHDAIIVCNIRTRRITYWNQGAERLYGWLAAEAKGREIGELVFANPEIPATVINTLLTAGEWRGEHPQLTKAGHEWIARCHATLVRDPHGAPKSALIINFDITEQRELEDRLLRSQRLESIGSLAGGIAHDFNNVLAPIMMAVGVLKRRMPDPASQELFSILTASAQHGADMVRQVLLFASGVGGQRQICVPIGPLLLEIEKIAEDTFLKHIDVRRSIADDLWTVTGDPTQIHQILLNLCVNARDAMPAGGTLTFSAQNIVLDAHDAALIPGAASGSYVLLRVADTGTGIPPEIVRNIFDPFFTTKGVGKGTGLGLSTTLQIVKNHGGFIHVETHPGTGTEFDVYLPARTRKLEPASVIDPATLPCGHDELILVVDDESSIRQIARQTLETFGYRVILAAGGTEALAIYSARHEEISVVLTDLAMPVMNGASTVEILRKIDPAVRIIAASGLPPADHARRLGVKHFLPKPYTAETLLGTLHEVLSAAS